MYVDNLSLMLSFLVTYILPLFRKGASVYDIFESGECKMRYFLYFAKAPRYMTFLKAGNVKCDTRQPYKQTEFIAFHRDQNSYLHDNNKTTLFCSRITRSYNPHGKYVQGSTSFFTLQPRNDGN